MKLFYDRNDLQNARNLRDDRLRWLQELGASEIGASEPADTGFLFSYEHGERHLGMQVRDRLGIHDQPDERRELISLDNVLQILKEHKVVVPMPKSWVIGVDDVPPVDLTFPLFLRTPKSSWKRGGEQGKVRNTREFSEEAELLRRAFGWDTPIIAREWLDLAVAGQWMFGDAPQEVRTWIVDGKPAAWNFHYLYAIPEPAGFPLSSDDLSLLKSMAAAVAAPFSSRLVVADFVRDVCGDWYFMEAGPGAVAGTCHEHVFKFVAHTLIDSAESLDSDAVGGPL